MFLMNLLLRFVQRIHSIQRILLHPFALKIQKNQKNLSYRRILSFLMYRLILHPQFVQTIPKNLRILLLQKHLKILNYQKIQQRRFAPMIQKIQQHLTVQRIQNYQRNP
jgi:hypothetical protein